MAGMLRAADVYPGINSRGVGYGSSRHLRWEIENPGSWPLLHQSVSNGDIEQVQHLLETGPDSVNRQHNSGIALLHLAIHCLNSLAMLDFLLQQSEININIQDSYGNTPMHYAASDEQAAKQLAQILEHRDLHRNAQNTFSMTALHYAVRSGCLENAELLLHNSASSSVRNRREPLDPNLQDSEGNTAMHEAVKANHPKMVNILLQCHMVEPDFTDRLGKTPHELAENLKYEGVIEVFKKYTVYDMSVGQKRALIINNEEFQYLPQRQGSGHDASQLEKQFTARGICVEKKDNRTAKQMLEDILEFREVCTRNPTSAMIICIMTHGQGEMLCGTDSQAGSLEFSKNRVLGMLAREHAPELAGIPKVILLHSCRDPPSDIIAHQASDGTVAEYGEAGFHASQIQGVPLSVQERVSCSPPDEDFLVVSPALANMPCPIGFFEPALARKLKANPGPVEWVALLRDVNRRGPNWACAETICNMKKSLWM